MQLFAYWIREAECWWDYILTRFTSQPFRLLASSKVLLANAGGSTWHAPQNASGFKARTGPGNGSRKLSPMLSPASKGLRRMQEALHSIWRFPVRVRAVPLRGTVAQLVEHQTPVRGYCFSNTNAFATQTRNAAGNTTGGFGWINTASVGGNNTAPAAAVAGTFATPLPWQGTLVARFTF